MTTREVKCPSPETLDDLLANRLPAATAAVARAHVAACLTCQTFLGRAPTLPAPFPFLSPPQATGDLGSLGAYRVRGVLGEGGMAIVFDAEHTVLQRPVALKVIKPGLSGPAILERFQREARALASLPHEHIVILYEVGEANGAVFLAMERLAGESLERRLDRDESLPLAEALALTREAAEGLAVAHAAGLVHRDVKPSNLWLEALPGGPFKRVKLIDFGIARSTQTSSGLTEEYAILGTPHYMAPEQAAGLPLDARADLYSLGCVLFRMLAGQAPIAGENTLAVLRAVTQGQALASLAEARHLPPAVAGLLRELLAVSPDDRPASAAVLIERLRRLEQDQRPGAPAPRTAPSPTLVARLRRRPATPGIWLGAIAIAAALVLGAVAAYHKFLAPGPKDGEGANVPAEAGAPLKVGILHSLTGTMSVHERPIVQATRLAIEEINRDGGVLGRQVVAVQADGASDEGVFGQRAEALIEEDGIEVLFGCWSSSSRKRVGEACARHDRLLFFPSGSEGLELSPHVVHLGGTPNQTVIPLVRWAYTDRKKRRFFLVGSESIYSHAVNAILAHEIAELGASVAGTRYALLGETDFAAVVREIQKTNADMVLCSIEGQSNVAFFQALRGAGLRPDKLPTAWFNISESELSLFRVKELEGDYSAGCYFGTLQAPRNQAFLKRFRARFSTEERVNDAMETAYFGVYLWKKAVEKAGSTDTAKVREALRNLTVDAPEGPIRMGPRTLYAYRTGRIGQVEVAGGQAQFRIVATSPGPVAPEPYPGWRTPAEWDRFLRGLYVGWGDRWEKHR